MSGTPIDGRTGRRAGPTYYRVRKRTPAELAALLPVRTKPIEFTGSGPGPWGKWRPGDPLGDVPADPDGMLDWAEVARARQHVAEIDAYLGAGAARAEDAARAAGGELRGASGGALSPAKG